MLRRFSARFTKVSLLKQCTRSLVVLNVNRAEDGRHWSANLRAAAAVIGLLATAQLSHSERDTNGVAYEKGGAITNWSATHTCSPSRQFEPKSAQEVCRVLEQHHATKTKIRPIGTALSPNGISMSNGDVLSVAALDYVEVDKERMLVTVGAGARVADVLKELGKYDLTLENFSSIQEQQMGGWTQVAAHGTGCTLPTGNV
jgi:L-galactono-1,4-lactone dehydrogenase